MFILHKIYSAFMVLLSHADIESLCIEMEKDERIHDMFYLKAKVFMTFIEAYCDSKDPVDVDKVVFRTKIVLQLIRKVSKVYLILIK